LNCSKQNKSTALTRESRPYIIKLRASFLEQGRKRWKDGLKRISCIYVTVANMSCQDVIMSLLQNYYVAKMSHPVHRNYAPVRGNYAPPSSEIVDPSEKIIDLTRPVKSVKVIRTDPFSGNKENDNG